MRELFSISASLHKFDALDIHQSLLTSFSHLLGSAICRVYGQLVSKHLSDKVNLQLLFDVNFLIKIFEGSWALDVADFPKKLDLKRQMQSLLSSFRAKVLLFLILNCRSIRLI